VTGAYQYVTDLRLPGMLHARMVRPSTLGSTLVKVDGFGGKTFPGVKVVTKGNLVAVVSANEWDAVQAADALKVTWTKWSGLPGSENIGKAMRSSPNPVNSTAVTKGDARAALAANGKPLEVSYEMPVVQHAPIGPHAAIADVAADGSIHIYSATSIPQILRESIAGMMSTSIDKVVVTHYEHSSQYGRTSLGGDDPVADAVLVSSLVGAPVRVQWSRTEDHMWSYKVGPMLHDMQASFDAEGNLAAWHHLNFAAGFDSRMLGGILAGMPGSTKTPPPGGGFGALWIYDKVPNVLIEGRGVSEFGTTAPSAVGMRFNIMRSPGNLQSAFGMESFMNEAAMHAKADPIAYRIRHTTDPRAIAVLQAVRKLSRWKNRASPAPTAAATGSDEVVGRGVAVALRNDGVGAAYVAAVCELGVTPSTGKVRLKHFWIANDSGLVVNPTGLGRVIESGVIQTASLALKEEVTFDTSSITSEDWSSYPLLTMAETPKIEWVFVGNSPSNPPAPAGEPIANVISPAITAAFLDATGKAMRRLPMKPKYVKSALGRSAAK
jgi:nicotinate dehydrogenase subunit B